MVAGINLPNDIMAEILVDFPIKSLLQFMCISKSWYSFITSPDFITAHLSHQKTSSPPYFLCRDCHEPVPVRHHHMFFLHNQDFNLYKKAKLPSSLPFNSHIVGRSCDGLLLVSLDLSLSKICLWNPTIDRFRILPGSLVFPTKPILIGFGFCPKTQDYNVVRVTFVDKKGFKAELYSLRSGSWKKIKNKVEEALRPINLFSVDSYSCNWANGVGYWICAKRENPSEKKLLSFDAEDEVFQEIPLPADCQPESGLALGEVDKSLVLVSWNPQRVWVLSSCDNNGISSCSSSRKSYCWKKLDPSHGGRSLVWSGGVLFSCESGSRKAEIEQNMPVISPSDTYIESLLLLDDSHNRFPESSPLLRRWIVNVFGALCRSKQS